MVASQSVALHRLKFSILRLKSCLTDDSKQLEMMSKHRMISWLSQSIIIGDFFLAVSLTALWYGRFPYILLKHNQMISVSDQNNESCLQVLRSLLLLLTRPSNGGLTLNNCSRIE